MAPSTDLPKVVLQQQSSIDDTGEQVGSMDARDQMHWNALWETYVQNRSKYIHYQKTVVLMLFWSESDLNLDEEIAELGEVFEKQYSFEVVKHVMDSRANPHKRLNVVLSQFVHENDVEGSLLIIYYAGHGWSQAVVNNNGVLKEKRFHLVHKSTKNAPYQGDKRMIAWHKAEQLLTTVEHADILGIFDCCDAGGLLNMRGQPRFEYLGACCDGENTHPGGVYSFTRALIWALKEFRDNKPFFTIHQLYKKIMDAPNFPDDQEPAWGQRVSSGDLITLSPTRQRLDEDAETQEAGGKNTAYLNLQFQFDSPITKEVFKQTAELLHELISHERLKAKRVAFLKKHDEATQPRFSFADIIERIKSKASKEALPTPQSYVPEESASETGVGDVRFEADEDEGTSGSQSPPSTSSRSHHSRKRKRGESETHST